MKKIILIFLCIAIYSLNIKDCLAQNFTAEDQKDIDSLNLIINSNEKDTALICSYVELSEIYYLSNPDTVIYLCNKAIEIAKKALNKKDSKVILETINECLSSAYNNIGVVYYYKGQIEKTLTYYLKSLEIEKQLDSKLGLATSYNNIGVVYKNQGNLQKALEYYFTSLKLREQEEDLDGMANSYNNIGTIYLDQRDLESSIEYFFKSLELRKKTNNKDGIAISYNNIGGIYYAKKEYEKALKYYNKCLAIRKELHDKMGVASTLMNMGLIFGDQNFMKKAENTFNESLQMSIEIEDEVGIIYCLNSLSALFFDENQVVKAKKYAEQSLKKSIKIGYPENVSDAAEQLYIISKKTGNYRKALKMYELYVQMKDSINNEDNQRAIIRQQTKYEFEKAQLLKEQQDKEILRLEGEKTKRRNNLQYSIIFVAILAVFGLVLALGVVSVSSKIAEGLIFFAFLLFFEFLLVLFDPYIENWTGGEPMYKLLLNAILAAAIFPLHAFFERYLKIKLIKNKRK